MNIESTRCYQFLAALALSETTRWWTLRAVLAGAFISLVTSYGLSLGWWEIEGANLSLANRIYHGFIMATFLGACLLIARERAGLLRVVACVVSLLVIYNVLNIETGRTGYLQVVAVCILLSP